MSAPPPPPLPRLPPPKAAQQASQQAPQQQQPAAQQNTVAQARDENDYIEPQMVFDNMFDDDGPLGGKVKLTNTVDRPLIVLQLCD